MSFQDKCRPKLGPLSNPQILELGEYFHRYRTQQLTIVSLKLDQKCFIVEAYIILSIWKKIESLEPENQAPVYSKLLLGQSYKTFTTVPI
jgi:hypothetical protein